MPQQDKLGSGWMVIAAAVFALMGALVKKAGSDFGFGFNELVFWRTAFGLVVLGGLALLRRQDFRTPHWHAHLSRGVAGTLGLMLFFYAIAHLPLATAVTLNYTSSLFLALLSFLLLKEKIAPNMLAGLFLGFVGIVILLRPTFAAGQEWAGLVGLSAGLAAGWAYLQVRELSLLGRTRLAGGVLFLSGRHRTLRCAGHLGRLASHQLRCPALFARHRHHRYRGPALPHPRLSGGSKVYRCVIVLLNRGVFHLARGLVARRPNRLAGNRRYGRDHRRRHHRQSGKKNLLKQPFLRQVNIRPQRN